MNEKAIEFVKPAIALNEWGMWILICIFLGVATLTAVFFVLHKIYYSWNWDVFAVIGCSVSAILLIAILVTGLQLASLKKFPEAYYNEKVRFNEKRKENKNENV